MNNEFREDASFQPWGPLISPNYKNESITTADIIVASVVWGLTLVNVIIGIWLAYGQSKASRSPLRSVYVWMIWLELVVSFVMGLECFLHLLKYIRPSKRNIPPLPKHWLRVNKVLRSTSPFFSGGVSRSSCYFRSSSTVSASLYQIERPVGTS